MARHNSSWSKVTSESTWTKFMSFSDRLNRSAFFIRYLALVIGTPLIILGLWFLVAFFPLGLLVTPFAVGFTIVFSILAFIAYAALHVRRLHDIGLSGLWFFLILAASIAGRPDEFVDKFTFLNYPPDTTIAIIARALWLIATLALILIPGTKGPNKYGIDPLVRGVELNKAKAGFQKSKNDPYDEDNFWQQ